jgi:hypothetical protein
MARQDELELALRDSITPGLRAIATELRELNKAAKESAKGTADEIDRVSKSTANLMAASKAAFTDVQNLFSKIAESGKSILGVGGTYEAVTKLTESLQELAMTRVQLAMFSQDTRITAENIDRLRSAMMRMGIDFKTATGYIGGMAGKLQELRTMREGSEIFKQLEKAPGGVEAARKLMNETDVFKQMKIVTELFKKQTPEMQYYIAQMFQMPQSVFANLDQYMGKVKDVYQINEQVAKDFEDHMADFREKMDNEWKIFGEHALDAVNKWFDRLRDVGAEQDEHAISKFFIEGFDTFDKKLQQDIADVQAFWELLKQIKVWADWAVELWRPDIKEKHEGEAAGRRLGESFKEFEGKSSLDLNATERMRLEEENKKLLSDIRDSLQKIEQGGAGGGGVGIRGGGIARGGRAASEGDVAGPMQATRGGFRPGTRGGDTAAIESRQFGSLAEQRAPYLKYLNEHPEVKEKLAAMLVSEEPSRQGRQGTAETFLNRMISHGIPPEQMATSIEGLASGPNVYYAPNRPGGTGPASAAQLARDPTLKAATFEDIERAAAGSNISGLGTQNASAGVAANAAQTSTVTAEAIKGIRDQYTRKDIRPDIHGPGTVAKESDWFKKTSAAIAREKIDAEAAKAKSDKGTASVTVDFGDTKKRTEESKEGGDVFKNLQNERPPQSPKSGSESSNFKDRWYFQ